MPARQTPPVSWWSSLSLHNKLQIPIQLVLLVALLTAQFWVTNEFRKELLSRAERRAIDSAAQAFWGLNSMMLNGNIRNPEARKVYFMKMSALDNVKDFHIARGTPVQNQFGPGMPEEQPRDEMDRRALASGQVQTWYANGPDFALRKFARKPGDVLRVVVPFAARHEFHGTNCLACHHVEEGAINGAVSMTIGLDSEHNELVKIRSLFTIGQILLQITLFFLIRAFIHTVIYPVSRLEKTMLAIEIDGNLDKRVDVRSEDEVGHIAQVFNSFLQHIDSLRKQLSDKVAMLEKYRTRLEEEQRVGGFIMSRMTQIPESLDQTIHHYVRPVEHLSGDILIATRAPDGTLYTLLADAVGHGLSAAINVLPLCHAFYDQAEKGFPVEQIVTSLNQLVHKFMPPDRFVAAALIAIHPATRAVHVWNGGIPPLLLLNRPGDLLQRWTSNHLPLGIASDLEFSATTASYTYHEDCQLYLFSDGLVEASDAQGRPFGEPRLLQLLPATAFEDRAQAAIQAIETHLDGRAAHDDISLAIITLCLHGTDGPAIISARDEQTQDEWHIAIQLGAAELKCLDVTAMLTELLSHMRLQQRDVAALFTILSELLNNALDHGLLQLDSSLKQSPDGFEEFLSMREARLQGLQRGKIELEIFPLRIAGKHAVRVRVADSGNGFNHKDYLAAPALHNNTALYGRGITLIRTLAHQLEFSAKGNEVVATYLCS